MKGKITAYVLSLIASIGMAGTAWANQEKFEELDTDGDGRISQQEASESDKLQDKFGEVDRDGNGYITPTEYSLHMDEKDRDQ